MVNLPRIAAGLISLILVLSSGLLPTQTAAADTATGAVHGVVTAPDGSVPDGLVTVNMTNGSDNVSVSVDVATGVFEADSLSPGTWSVYLYYHGSSNYVRPLEQNTLVTAGVTTELTLRFLAGATISGHFTGADAPLTSGTVQLDLINGYDRPTTTYDVATQTWTATEVPPGAYRVSFYADDSLYSRQFWNQQGAPNLATPLNVAEGANIAGIDATMQRGASADGYVEDDNDGVLTPAGLVTLVFWLGTGPIEGTGGANAALTDSDGHYRVSNLYPGTYTVCAEAGTQPGGTCSPATFTVVAGQSVSLPDIVVPVVGTIAARVTTLDAEGAPTGFWGVQAEVWSWDSASNSWLQVDTEQSGGDGSVFVGNLVPGDYKIRFVTDHLDYDSLWWNGKHFMADATVIHLRSGEHLDLGDVLLPSRDFEVARTYGPDRFSGAVAMTQAIWAPPTEVPGDGGVPPGGVPVIYIANGLKYPDALSAGPAAIFQGGALLLVAPTSIPSSVATELTRLRPQKIVIVGGPASVSADVEAQLIANAAHDGYPTEVTRQSGADRFQASRNLAGAVWNAPGVGGAPQVFIATGNNFPDALAAGPAAGLIGAPVILVNGLQSHLDQATEDLLVSLGTTDVDIVGGPNSVTPGIESDLAILMHGSNHVHRYSGATRYDAAAAMNQDFFPQAETVFAATGANFPDALAGAPLAGVYGAPIYLTQPDCLSQVVAEHMLEDDTQGIWLLGGPASLSPAVEDLEVCAS